MVDVRPVQRVVRSCWVSSQPTPPPMRAGDQRDDEQHARASTGRTAPRPPTLSSRVEVLVVGSGVERLVAVGLDVLVGVELGRARRR